jgi:hypothetical protein
VNSGTAPTIDAVNNSGIVVFAGAGMSTGLYVQTAGETHLGGHSLNASNPVQIIGGGLFDGGTINADLVNGGQITPGGLSILDANGNYAQLPGGTLNMSIAGPYPGQFNQLETSGNAYLAGNLKVTFLNGFTARQQDSFPLVVAGAIPTPFGSVTIINGGALPLEMIYSAHMAALAPVPPPLPTYFGPAVTSSFGFGLGYLFPSSRFASAASPAVQAADDLFRILTLGRLGGDASGDSASAESAGRFDRSSLITSSLHGADDLSVVESGADDDLVAALLSAAGALDGSMDNDVLSGFDLASRLLTGYQPKADILAQKGSRAASVATLTSGDAGEFSTARTEGGADDDLPLEHFLIDPVRRERPPRICPNSCFAIVLFRLSGREGTLTVRLPRRRVRPCGCGHSLREARRRFCRRRSGRFRPCVQHGRRPRWSLPRRHR